MARKKYIYEVRMIISPKIAKSFRIWLDDHLDDMLSLRYFTDGQIIEGVPLDQPHLQMYIARYNMHNQQDLNDYLQNAAPQMRSKLPAEFHGTVEYSRALLIETIST